MLSRRDSSRAPYCILRNGKEDPNFEIFYRS